MTKSEFIEKLVSKYQDLPAADVRLAASTIFETMATALENGERIEVRGFGGFSVRHLSERQGRNPKTGETVHVPPRAVVHFKPWIELRERVNNIVNRMVDA